MICKNIRKRQYNLKPYFWCSKLRKEIEFKDCNYCKHYEVRTYKPIPKVSTKREFVKPDTYRQVAERDKYMCRLSHDGKCEGRLELHHIVYRSEDKSLINEPRNCIMLCTYHHKLVHRNKHKYQELLKEIIERGN